MQWLRIDTYYGSQETRSVAEAARNPQVHFQPMMCQHCENAPCEYVCPVEATTHSEEGINEMTYNRCIGTRYCQNNCPYKVRRFNFFQYNDIKDQSLWAMRNPEVTVRMRGVMEKCTYCIQRVDQARINGKKAWVENDASGQPTPMRTRVITGLGPPPEDLPALDVMTACQQACPTEAITFGDLNDASSHVARLRYEHPWAQINYGVLVDLNTQPRTTYLEHLRNPAEGLKQTGGQA
jgi:molybdopterin-containing oxidoreductase family iron-sulfur binding subunit